MKEFFKQFLNHLKNCRCFQDACFLCAPAGNVQAVKMPFFKLAFRPFNLFLNNLKPFILLAAAYSVLLSFLLEIMGLNPECFYSATPSQALYCSSSGIFFILFLIIKLFVVAVFMVKWTAAVINKQPLNSRRLFKITQQDIKMFGLLVLFLILNSIPALSMYLLYIRVPNPDWIVEITYFAIVSIGFLVPFWLTRIYAIFAFVAEDRQVPKLRLLWDKTAGNNLKIILALFFIFILAILAFTSYFTDIQALSMQNLVYPLLVMDFLYNIVFFIIITLLLCHCRVQQEILFAGDEIKEQIVAEEKESDNGQN